MGGYYKWFDALVFSLNGEKVVIIDSCFVNVSGKTFKMISGLNEWVTHAEFRTFILWEPGTPIPWENLCPDSWLIHPDLITGMKTWLILAVEYDWKWKSNLSENYSK